MHRYIMDLTASFFLLSLAALAAAFGPDPQVCASCEFSNGIGYLPDTSNCRKYLQCQEIEHPDGRITYVVHVLPCAPGTYWRQDLLTCGRDYDELYPCPPPGCDPVVVDPCDGITTEETATWLCHLAAVPGDPSHFLNAGIMMACAPGTVYDHDECGCVAGGTVEACSDDPIILHPLTEHYDNIQCLGGVGTSIGGAKITGGCLCFEGEPQRVELGLLKNWFSQNNVRNLTITLWFYVTSAPSGRQGLYGNGDCYRDATIGLYLEGSNVVAQLTVEEGGSTQQTSVTAGFTAGQWNHVAMVYTGWALQLWLNGRNVGPFTPLQGAISDTQLHSTLGMAYIQCDPNFYTGCMCDFRVYDRVLYWSDINNLYQAGSCPGDR